jgi:sporulation protein YlmC with PRC-barrel domain
MRVILLALAGVAAFALSQAAAAQESVRNSPTSQLFVAISEGGNFSSQVVGLDVYNDTKQYIGQIEDIAMSQDGQTQAYILSVGGILGMGEHYVAVNPSAVKVSYSELDKAWHASMNATSDQLRAVPEFRYSGHLAAKACINILH